MTDFGPIVHRDSLSRNPRHVSSLLYPLLYHFAYGFGSPWVGPRDMDSYGNLYCLDCETIIPGNWRLGFPLSLTSCGFLNYSKVEWLSQFI
jgi:hypothetical protein